MRLIADGGLKRRIERPGLPVPARPVDSHPGHLCRAARSDLCSQEDRDGPAARPSRARGSNPACSPSSCAPRCGARVVLGVRVQQWRNRQRRRRARGEHGGQVTDDALGLVFQRGAAIVLWSAVRLAGQLAVHARPCGAAHHDGAARAATPLAPRRAVAQQAAVRPRALVACVQAQDGTGPECHYSARKVDTVSWSRLVTEKQPIAIVSLVSSDERDLSEPDLARCGSLN